MNLRIIQVNIMKYVFHIELADVDEIDTGDDDAESGVTP